ncbi:g6431 [Coccomyxa viridis]|uniref:G6431 protein n=1 Tax=Coccomyxa viridis TaxID=1274662 RepID=A0ABP1FVD4_9CHLO
MDHPMGEPSQAPQEVLPLMRVKKLMKEEADVKAVAGDASYAAARATEFLIEELARRAFDITAKSNRDIISYNDIATAVSEWPAAIFLQDIVPKRMPLSELIKRLRDTEQRQNSDAQKPAAALANGNTATPAQQQQPQATPMQQDTEQPMAPVQASLPQKSAMQPHVQQHYAPLQQQPTPLPQGPIMQQLQQQQQSFSHAPGLPVQQMGAPAYRP